MAARHDSTELLRSAKLPVLVLAGASDQVIAPEKAKALATSIPNARLVMVEHAGHMPMLEQPQATTTAIREFLSA
jgi:pimeloyl-ACP methyl ester carboxylesterase